MKRLDNFLYCFNLETGGLFYGWFGIVSCVFSLLISIIFIVGVFAGFIDDQALQQMGYGDPYAMDNQEMNQVLNGRFKVHYSKNFIMKLFLPVLLTIFIVVLVVSVLYIAFCIMLIRGTKKVGQIIEIVHKFQRKFLHRPTRIC